MSGWELFDEVVARLKGAKRTPDGRILAWCPFHADGEGVPPHQANLYVSERWYICHACGAKGPLRELAERLGVERPQESDSFEATYDYRDENGEVLYQVVRCPGKKFRQRRPDGQGGWIWKLGEVRRVPYHLPELLARPDEPLFIVEGEKDADRLHSLGLLATTNSGGANKWRPTLSTPLRGRDVVILPDNDEAGRSHAAAVARSLHGIARTVKIVDLPDLPNKGDVSNWLDAGHSPAELTTLVEAAPLWINQPEASPPPDTNAGGVSQSDSLAKQIVDLVLDSGIELFHDEREEPYARVATKRGSRIVPVSSRTFRKVLAGFAWKGLEKAPGGEVLSSAMTALGSIAYLDNDQHRLWVRHAAHDRALWVDLDGCRAARITTHGWTIVDDPPILFRSFPHQRPLPDPVRGGDPWTIFEFLNLPDEDSRTLLKGLLVAAFVPNIPVAGLALHGVQGSAKSTLLRALKRILDPSGAEVRRGVKDATELAQILFQNRLVLFDNLTSLPGWMSDALCGAITGDGWSKRALYTDEDSILFEYQRAIGIGGINLVVQRADLLDRCVLLELQPIRGKRREETELWATFEVARPTILGGLLDLVSKAMATAPTLKLAELPRMADFCRWGAAAAVADGLTPEFFSSAYHRNIGRQSDAALDASPVGEALAAFMSGQATWSGPPGKLLDCLTEIAEKLHINTRSKSWPKAANWMSHRLKEVQPSLEARGIRIETERTGGGRTIRIQKVTGNCVTCDTSVTEASEALPSRRPSDAIPSGVPSHCVTDCVTLERGPGPSLVPYDASDGNDAIPGVRVATEVLDDVALHEDFEERAAIIEFDAGLGRRLAEEQARREGAQRAGSEGTSG